MVLERDRLGRFDIRVLWHGKPLTKMREYAEWGDAKRRGSRGRVRIPVDRRIGPYIGRVVFDTDLQADLTQETLVRVLGSLSGLRDAGRFWPWVYAIAANATRRNPFLIALSPLCNPAVVLRNSTQRAPE